MSNKQPPFQITSEILNLCTEITRVLGRIEGLKVPVPQPKLRRKNRIKTIHSSLAIEGNKLTEQQVTDIKNRKRVIGSQKDILEVKNAINAYELLQSYKINKPNSLLKAHAVMMKDLTDDAGRLRTRNVGIFKGQEVTHMAPKYQMVPKLIKELFAFLKRKDDIHPLIKSCVFHYELEFIHPFSDGNGRLGRLWQTAILLNFHPLFEYIPVESIVRIKQKQYYKALGQADKSGDSTGFIRFMLNVICQAVKELFINIKPQPETTKSRLIAAQEHFKIKAFSRKDYIVFHKNISTATASRDLLSGVKRKILKKSGKKALTKYLFKASV